jgi:hypothetical protein
MQRSNEAEKVDLASTAQRRIVFTALYQTQKVHATPNDDHHGGCSVASLKGTYAFLRTGVSHGVGGPIAELGLDVINGDGTRGPTRVTASQNGVILDWTNFRPYTGSYVRVRPGVKAAPLPRPKIRLPSMRV